NKRGIIFVVSGGYFSKYTSLSTCRFKTKELLDRGYTVFYVMHGSAPVYSGTDIITDIQKSIQFIRYHAGEYKIDPEKIGITGNSSGGNLALLMGVTDAKSATGKDTLKRISSRVQSVACFYPPTDFLNFGKANTSIITDSTLYKFTQAARLLPAFDFYALNDTTLRREVIKDKEKKTAILKAMSPIYFVDEKTPPILIYHGDCDLLVPIQQSQTFMEKLKTFNIKSNLLVKKGKGHTWGGESTDMKIFADWFDETLK
ncbi:MAG: prolyl oligopeptidase family serine peptidase, partial [Bacteroidia bacterium]|nr:prolyl oligopeptidase family serine peptidase [Bacteroidia bacterium]